MCGSKKRRTILSLALFWALGLLILGTGFEETVMKGPLREVLKKEETKTMLVHVLAVFLWNLGWLSLVRRRKAQIAGTAVGVLGFAWCHQMLVPAAVSGAWLLTLIGAGDRINHLMLGNRTGKNYTSIGRSILFYPERIALGLVTGSAFWMAVVCGVSLTGHGGIGLWRILALALGFLTAAVWLMKGRFLAAGENAAGAGASVQGVPRRGNTVPGSVRGRFAETFLPDNFLQALLTAFILTMILIQAGRLNIELDYDSLHYGLRSPFVLDNGKGIYENLGMINLVYSYSKGAEVLNLPLSGTATYGFVLTFSFWTTVGTVLLAGHMGKRSGGKNTALWTAAVCAAIPGIMNMAVSAKSDSITLLYQVIIYDFLCLAAETSEEKGEKETPWLLMAVAAYLVTLVFKPTALVFSTGLGAAGLLSLLLRKKLRIGNKRGFLLWIFPLMATAGLWYRTWRIVGVPVTSIFAGMCEKIGFEVKYPFSFANVIGNPWALSAGEKLARLAERLKGILLAPVVEDMEHVIIAWGTGLVTALLLLWCVSLCLRVKGKGTSGTARDLFDGLLMAILLAGSVLSIYTLTQVDGNYFMLVYAVLAISAVRMAGDWLDIGRGIKTPGRILRAGLCLLAVPFFLFSAMITCTTSWAGTPGFTPVKWTGKGYYDHRAERSQRRIRRGYENLACGVKSTDRVLAFGFHPEILDLDCSVQSYYDVTGSGGNVYLVKKLAYFEEFLEYAGIDYFFVQAGYLAEQPRALEIIEDMIEEGTLTDLTFEWGNMRARVALDQKTEELQTAQAEIFRKNYCMSENGFR